MSGIVGKPLHEGIRYETMRDLILGSKEKYGTRDSFIFRRKPNEAEIHKTYNDFASDIEYLVEAIRIEGFAGRHLGVVGENAYEWVVSYSAILSSGSVGLPLDRLLPEQELVSLLVRGRSAFLSSEASRDDPEYCKECRRDRRKSAEVHLYVYRIYRIKSGVAEGR